MRRLMEQKMFMKDRKLDVMDLFFHRTAAADLACKRMLQLFTYDRISQRTGNLVVKTQVKII